MTSNKPKFAKECPSHAEEPIIRASLDLKSSKILYCHECLEGMAKNTQSNLIKSVHISDRLHEQLTERYEHFQKSESHVDFNSFAINKEEYEKKVEEIFSQRREQMEQEFDKVKTELMEILTSSKNVMINTLDRLKTCILSGFGGYTEKVKGLIEVNASKEKGITKEEIENEINNSEEDVETIEKRIRAKLETIKLFDEIKEGTITGTLETMKNSFENDVEKLLLIPPKENEYYKNALAEVGDYLQAILLENKDKKDEQKGLDIISGYAEHLEKLDKTVQTSQSSLKKIKEQLVRFLASIPDSYQPNTSTDKKKISPNVNSRNRRPNEIYDEGFDVESDDENAEIPSEQILSRSRSRSRPRRSRSPAYEEEEDEEPPRVRYRHRQSQRSDSDMDVSSPEELSNDEY